RGRIRLAAHQRDEGSALRLYLPSFLEHAVDGRGPQASHPGGDHSALHGISPQGTRSFRCSLDWMDRNCLCQARRPKDSAPGWFRRRAESFGSGPAESVESSPMRVATNFTPIDWLTVVVYLLGSLAVGIYAHRYVGRLQDYLVAGRTVK